MNLPQQRTPTTTGTSADTVEVVVTDSPAHVRACEPVSLKVSSAEFRVPSLEILAGDTEAAEGADAASEVPTVSGAPAMPELSREGREGSEGEETLSRFANFAASRDTTFETGGDVAGVDANPTQRSGTRLSSTLASVIVPASAAPALETREGMGKDAVGAGDVHSSAPASLEPETSNLEQSNFEPRTQAEAAVQSSEFEVQSSTVPRLTESALQKGAERARILKAVRPLVGTMTQGELATLAGVSEPTMSRLLSGFAHLPDEELTPENLASKTGKCGRPSPWLFLASDEKIRQRLQELYLLSCGASSEYMTHGRRTGSVAAALKVFSRDPLCPPALAIELRAGKQPAPLVSVIREITDLVEQHDRGAKHSSLHAQLIMRRTLTEILADGSEQQIQPGDWWVFDDMSDNLPHWWTGPEELPLIGRQGLYAYDVTKRWLGVEKIGTVRDSYTAAIILRFLRQLMQTFGKPRRGVVFERSVWQSRSITGVRVKASGVVVDEEIERAAMDPREKTLIQDGLRSLGLIAHYTYTPRGKEIEGAFNYLQKLKPMFAAQRNVPRSGEVSEERNVPVPASPPSPLRGTHPAEVCA